MTSVWHKKIRLVSKIRAAYFIHTVRSGVKGTELAQQILCV